MRRHRGWLLVVLAVVLCGGPAFGDLIMALGDSVTQGYPYGPANSSPNPASPYPAQLPALLDAAYGSGARTVVNEGVDGRTADELAAALAAPGLLDQNPDLTVLAENWMGAIQATPEPCTVVLALVTALGALGFRGRGARR